MREDGPLSIGEAIADFLDDCAISGKSPQTVTAYGYKLRSRLDLAAPVETLDSRRVRGILSEEVRRSAPTTAATIYACLRSFGKWLAQRGYVAVNPCAELPKPRVPEPESKHLSERQTAALWDACFNDHERLLLALFLGTGARRGELAAARMQDIDWERGTLRLFGKGRKWRKVILPAKAAAILKSRQGETGSILGLGDRALYRAFKRIASRAGLPWAWPHLCRHSYFTDAISRGLSFTAAVQLGGWTDDRMLKQTYARTAIEDAALAEARRLDQG